MFSLLLPGGVWWPGVGRKWQACHEVRSSTHRLSRKTGCSRGSQSWASASREVDCAPVVALGDGGVEMHLDGKRAAVVKVRKISGLIDVQVPALLDAEAGQRNWAGKEFQCAAFRIFHIGVAGQGESGHVAAELAGQLEVLQSDAGAGGEAERQKQKAGKMEEIAANFLQVVHPPQWLPQCRGADFQVCCIAGF